MLRKFSLRAPRPTCVERFHCLFSFLPLLAGAALRYPSIVRPTVLLFDIDGTLVDTGGAGRRAMERAFERRTGRADACRTIPFAGMTDRAIARAGLEHVGHRVDELAIDALLDAYVEILADEISRADRCRILEGIEAALDRVDTVAGVALGLGTGNIVGGARLKLGKVGLFDRFAFGGFGSDHESRAELLRVGAVRGAERLGVEVAACRVVVVGDTPRDVDAALAIGAECVAVATGSYGVDALAAAGATLAVASLAAAGAVEALLDDREGVGEAPPITAGRR